MKEDEMLEHYNFHVEQCEDCKTIPLSFKEWKDNHLEDLLFILKSLEDE